MTRPAPKPAARRHPLDEEPLPPASVEPPAEVVDLARTFLAGNVTALNVKIPAHLHDRVRVDAAKSRQHMAQIVAEALAAWYEAHPDRGL